MTETGILVVGVEYDGQVHREFELRALKVRDTVDLKDSPHAERAAKNDEYHGVCLMAIRLEKLGEIPKKEITPELLMDMLDEDLGEIVKAEGRLKRKLRSFRDETQATEENDPGAPEDGVHAGSGDGDDGSGSGGLARDLDGAEGAR